MAVKDVMEHLREVVHTQRRIRGLEPDPLEGGITPLYDMLETILAFNLITMWELQELQDQLNAPSNCPKEQDQ